MFNWLKNIFSCKSDSILVFSDIAYKEITNHLKTLDKLSCFKLQVARDRSGRGQILVGFDKPDSKDYLVSIRGINTAFVGKSYETLYNAGVDWDDKGNVLIYPRIDLSTEETPNKSIIAFITNKILLSGESELSFGAWERGEKVKLPILIINLFKYKFIQSIYLTKNRLQIELKKSLNWKDHEEKVAEIILDYLESLPDPIRLFRSG